MTPSMQLFSPSIWPPTTGQWALLFLALFALVVVLTPWFRGRLLLGLALAADAGSIAAVLALSDARLALATAILLFAGAVVTGSAVLRLLGFRKPEALDCPEWIGFGALAGFGAFSAGAGLFAIPRWLNGWTAGAMLVALPLLSYRYASGIRTALPEALKSFRHEWRSEDLRWPAFGVAALSIVSAFSLMWALAPSVQWDANAAHLPVSAAIASRAGFGSVSQFWFSYVPGQVYLLFGLGLVTAGEPLPGLLHFSFGAVAALLIFGLGRRIGGAPAGWIAAMAFASMPEVAWEAGTCYIDLFPTAFGIAAIYALLRWKETFHQPWLTAAGLLLGLGAACKLTAAFLVLPVAACAAFVAFRGRRPGGAVVSVLICSLPVALFLAPWYIRNWVWTHNPFYPAMAKFFGNREVETLTFNWSHFGVGKGPLYFLRLPYDFVVHGPAFDETGYVIFGFVPLLAVLCIPLLWSPRWKSARPLAFMVVGGVAVWYSTAQVARYVLPAIAGAAVLAALPLAALATSSRRVVRLASVSVLLVGGAASLAYLRGIGTRWNYNIADGYPYRHALGLESSQDYLKRALRIYPAIDFLNHRNPPPSKVYAPNGQMRWGLRATLEDPIYRPDRAFLAALPGGNALAAELRSKGYEYLLIDTPMVRDPASPYRNEDFLKRHYNLLFANPLVFVYQLRPAPLDADARDGGPAQLLENGGFNRIDAGGNPAAWLAFGKPRVVVKPKAAHSAPAFVDVSQEDGFLQRVAVQAGSVYTVRLWARSDQKGQSAWIQLLWLDRQLKMLGTSITPAAVTSDWKLYSASVTPENPETAFAQVYTRAAIGNHVQVDDISIVQGW